MRWPAYRLDQRRTTILTVRINQNALMPVGKQVHIYCHAQRPQSTCTDGIYRLSMHVKQQPGP